MIYFVSKNFNQVYNEENLTVIDSVEDYKNLLTIFNQKDFGFDLETTGIDPFIYDILLIIIGNKRHQLVIDPRNSEILDITLTFLKENQKTLILGANLKFDYKFINVKYNIDLFNMFDVMIVEQRLYQGLGITPTNPLGLLFGLEAIIKRRLPNVVDIDKSIRDEFIGKNVSTFVFANTHIKYASDDIKYLQDIKEQQEIQIKKQKQEYLIYNIEFPLIRVLGKMEINGFSLDEESWIKVKVANIQKRYELELKADAEIKHLFNTLPISEKTKLRLKASNFFYNRPAPINANMVGLFGEELGNKEIFGKKIKKINIYEKVINYTSATQIINLFAHLEKELPTDTGLFIVPILNDENKIENSFYKFSTNADNLENYINEKINPELHTLISYIIEIGSLSTKIDTFGDTFIKKYKNKVTNKIHTIYRQCSAVTGRLQSGDKDNNYYNSQNIPAGKEYRYCFVADKGYSIVTSDLSGAEVIIMCSKAQDSELKRMAIEEDDIHSPLSQDVWRHIYLYRALCNLDMCSTFESFKTFISAYTKEELEHSVDILIYENHKNEDIFENLKKFKEFIITKKINKHIRTQFKSTSFGSVYGMFYKKAAKTLGVNNEEGKICLWRIKSKIPKTFAMVENNAKTAIKQGYLILNEKTNSRIWYPEVLRFLKYKTPLDFMTKIKIESSAKNSPIQGTQADMIKECLVEIQKYIDLYDLDCTIKLSIHDEIVVQQPLNMDGISKEWQENPKKVKFLNSKGEEVEDSFPILVKETMKRVSNTYLTNIEMQSEIEIGNSWIK